MGLSIRDMQVVVPDELWSLLNGNYRGGYEDVLTFPKGIGFMAYNDQAIDCAMIIRVWDASNTGSQPAFTTEKFLRTICKEALGEIEWLASLSEVDEVAATRLAGLMGRIRSALGERS